MSTEKAAEKEPLVAVYLSFKTFQSAVANLRSHGLPPKLDKSAWSSRSGGEQSAIWSAFKFLGLIDEDGNVSETLQNLVNVEENSLGEKEIVKNLLYGRYGKVFEIDLDKATPNQLSAAIGKYNVEATTRDRATRFFLKAAEHAGMKLSPRLKKGFRVSAVRRTPRTRGRDEMPTNGDSQDEEERGQQIKTIELPAVGADLTISGTFNPFELEGDERELVYKIVDLMKAFEKQHKH